MTLIKRTDANNDRRVDFMYSTGQCSGGYPMEAGPCAVCGATKEGRCAMETFASRNAFGIEYLSLKLALIEIEEKANSGDWTLPSSFANRARAALSEIED